MKKNIFFITILVILLHCNIHAKDISPNTDNDYKNSVKTTFLSWISGSTKISYERAFSTIHQSGELCTCLIGIGHDKYGNNPKGFSVRYGHKFFMNKKQRQSLEGFYLRPEIVYSQYSYDCMANATRSLSKETALLGTIGYQFKYNRLLTDLWVGAGYATGTPADTYYHHGFELWHFFDSINTNIALSFSIRIGFCF